VDLARSLLEDYSFQEIIWTDTDVVWLRSPLAFFASHPTADMAIQTDCLSHFVETSYTKPFQHHFSRCGHMPGNNFNNAFNTGMILLRNRAGTHGFLKAWLDYITDANHMYVDVGKGSKAVVGDQLAFNTLMTRNSQPWESVDATEDWRVVWGHDKTVKVLQLAFLLLESLEASLVPSLKSGFQCRVSVPINNTCIVLTTESLSSHLIAAQASILARNLIHLSLS
jgi:hypothetical protein